MERKIGEIFEYNGEWYQCVEGNGCENCAFKGRECYLEGGTDDPIGECCYDRRRDDKDVIFKKLEKVGEPIIYMSRTFQRLKSPDAEQCKYCYFGNQVCNPQLCGKESFLVEIKPTKEDMEDNKLNLKPFDIQKAREGKPVCTRDGHKARIICFDAKCNFPIIALITQSGGDESLAIYNSDGRFTNLNESDCDLMMLHKKKEGWININKDAGLFKSKEEAERNCTKDYATVRVEFEI